MKKEAGFTLIEILAVVVLLGLLLSLIWNMMVQNAFQQKRVKDEMEAQNSAKALLNHIGEIVMEQNVPIISQVDANEEFAGTTYEDTDVRRIKFSGGSLLTKIGQRVKLEETMYEYIENISVIVKDRSLTVTITGVSDKSNAEFSSTFYTRNS
jgi:prepilin-type N-terminal cleavage/methylation domain-containing protein